MRILLKIVVSAVVVGGLVVWFANRETDQMIADWIG